MGAPNQPTANAILMRFWFSIVLFLHALFRCLVSNSVQALGFSSAFDLNNSILKLLFPEYFVKQFRECLSNMLTVVPLKMQAPPHVHKPCVRPTSWRHLQQTRSRFRCIGSSIMSMLKMNQEMFLICFTIIQLRTKYLLVSKLMLVRKRSVDSFPQGWTFLLSSPEDYPKRDISSNFITLSCSMGIAQLLSPEFGEK